MASIELIDECNALSRRVNVPDSKIVVDAESLGDTLACAQTGVAEKADADAWHTASPPCDIVSPEDCVDIHVRREHSVICPKQVSGFKLLDGDKLLIPLFSC
jgi:hypothetical protein